MMNQPYLLPTKHYTSPSGGDGYDLLQVGFSQLIRLVGENTNGATRYLQVHDSATVPGDGAVPLLSLKLATATQGVFDFSVIPVTVFAGLVIAVSSTGPTLTKATGVFMTAQFV